MCSFTVTYYITDDSRYTRPNLQGSVIGPINNLHVGSSEDETKPGAQRKSQATQFKVAPQPSAGAKVMQVSPTPKTAMGRPANLHDLLVQLGLDQYEKKFIEQEIDLEVGGSLALFF